MDDSDGKTIACKDLEEGNRLLSEQLKGSTSIICFYVKPDGANVCFQHVGEFTKEQISMAVKGIADGIYAWNLEAMKRKMQ
jgi:hypothetical protein